MSSKSIYNIDIHSFNFGLDRLHSLAEMMEAGKRYPYSLPVQAYLARTLKQSNDFDYERFEKISAILSPDRQWLYRFIQAQPQKIQEKPTEIKQIEIQPVEPVVEIKPEQKEAVVLTISEVKIEEVEIPENLSFTEVTEVSLPSHELAVADDGASMIDQVLQHTKLVVPEPPVEPEPEPVIMAKIAPVKVDDLLEREILKEAIDKSIQKEVSEIQSDFALEKTVETEPQEQENDTATSFQYWLNPSRKKVETREEKLRKIDALIEKFIKSEPRIVPKKAEFFSPATAAKQSVVVNEDLVSEPLALIFEKQGYFDKAIKAYEKLSLKIPEKRAYFATRIEKIKEIVRNIKNNKE